MLKKIITLLLIIIIAINLGIFSGCRATLSLEETETQKTEVNQVIKTEDNERKRDQEEFMVLCGELNALFEKYSEDINTLRNKSIDTKDSNKRLAYEELILEKYESWYDDFTKIYAPSIAEEAYNYYLSFLSKQILAEEESIKTDEIIAKGDTDNIDRAYEYLDKSNEYSKEADIEFQKFIKEMERIKKELSL